VLLIRTYAFFNRNKLVLAGLLCALGGMVAYQLYVDTSQMLGKPRTAPYVLKAGLIFQFCLLLPLLSYVFSVHLGFSS